MVRDLELIKDIGILLGKQVVLWGAGNHGQRMYVELNMMKPERDIIVCDSSKSKQGVRLGKTRVVLPDSLAGLIKMREAVILISVDSMSICYDIIDTIKELGYDQMPIYTKFAYDSSLYLNQSDDRLNPDFKKMYQRQRLLEKEKIIARFNCQIAEDYMIDIWHASIGGGGVLVYQPGKVGSTTLANSLEAFGIRAFHEHILNNKKMESVLYKGVRKEFLRDIFQVKRKVITAVREPIARDISLFWQRLGSIVDIAENKFQLDGMSSDLISQYEISLATKTLMPDYLKVLQDEFEWFNGELKEVTGIDIYQYPFDRESGYSIIEKGNISLLVLKLEKMSQLEGVIGAFAGIENFKIISGNKAKEKSYSFAYQEFKKKVRIPREYVDHYYKGNIYLDYFYTTEEKHKFLEKWSAHIIE